MTKWLRLVGLACLLAMPSHAGLQAQESVPEATPAPAPRPPRPPAAFRTPEAGFAALASAVGAGDERALLRVLGESAARLIRSGDRVADSADRARFAAAYAARQEITRPAPDRALLLIGEDGWPFPLPMVAKGGVWRFDARAGAQALIDRRIGANELDTIETLRAIADAEFEYARTTGRADGFRSYARRFFSTPGQRDGLYWPEAEGVPPSPLGPLAAAASTGGYGRGDGPQPYHGYLFRILESQGPAARGGALDYVVGERMLGGFAVLAFPAQYGSTGIKSFLISHHGSVYERDLGPDTARTVAGITRFDPGPGWTQVAE